MVEVIAPDDADHPDTTELVRPGLPPWTSLVVVVAVLVLAFWLLQPGDGRSPGPETDPAEPVVEDVDEAVLDRDLVGPGGDEPEQPTDETVTFEFEAPGDAPPVKVVALAGAGRFGNDGGGDRPRFWSIDLDAGVATALPLHGIELSSDLADVRFFGADRAVGLLDDGDYVVLGVGSDRVVAERVIDIGDRDSFGLDTGLAEDGSAAWLGVQFGLVRWRLSDDRVNDRWIDSFGDGTGLPLVKAEVAAGLVVEAGARSFLIQGGLPAELDIDGEVMAGAGDWLLVRSCDDRLRCRALTLHNLRTSQTVSLDEMLRFRVQCGLMTRGAAEGTVVIVLQRLGRLLAVQVAADGTLTPVDLHSVGIGCVDAAAHADGLIVGHNRSVSVVDDDGEVELVELAGLRPILAMGAGPAN